MPDSDGGVPADLAGHPKFEILQLLGQGGMGAVYKARHKVMDRLVALKVLNAQVVGSEKAVERFRREVQAAARLQHANIVTAFDADQAGGTHFLVMELVEGTDLAKYLQQKGPLPVAHACHFIRQAALGLQHAHERGMVHRDIKPHNLMLTAGGVVKVMDFGLARLAQEGASPGGLTGENVLMGTADYIAPEQAQDAHAADIRADIYSLGCSLYHLLAGKPPFEGDNVVQKIMAHVTAAPPWADLPAGTPEGLRRVLAKMMEKDPAQRYQTPAEVAQALAAFVKKAPGVKPPPVPAAAPPTGAKGDRTITPEPAPAPKRVGKRKRGRRWPVPLWVGGGVLATGLLAASIVWLTSRGRHPSEVPSPGNIPPGSSGIVQPAALPAKLANGLGMKLALIPAGEFVMGSPDTDPDALPNEKPQRTVRIVKPFYLGAHEVTVGQFRAFVGANKVVTQAERTGGAWALDTSGKSSSWKQQPGYTWKQPGFKQGDDHPVVAITWTEANDFCAWLGTKEDRTYRLPTAAEWEYACRAGTTTRYATGDDAASLRGHANVADVSVSRIWAQYPTRHPFGPHVEWDDGFAFTSPVGTFPANAWGLYDMHGNVREFVGPQPGFRGGSFGNGANVQRCASVGGSGVTNPWVLDKADFAIGFRVVCEVAPPP